MSWHRQPTRLSTFDYSTAGAYFVTVCTHNREPRFGTVGNREIMLSPAGRMVEDEWSALAGRFPLIQLDAFVVMPEHVHGVIFLLAASAEERGTPARRLGQIVGAFKSLTTRRYIEGVRSGRYPQFSSRLWQRNYYDHVIRNAADLDRVRRYILENPFAAYPW